MRFLFFTLLLIVFSLSLQAQTQLTVSTNSKSEASGQTRFHYVFENDKFTMPWIEIEFGADGKGEFRFRKRWSINSKPPL
jgi:hypothetical protein